MCGSPNFALHAMMSKHFYLFSFSLLSDILCLDLDNKNGKVWFSRRLSPYFRGKYPWRVAWLPQINILYIVGVVWLIDILFRPDLCFSRIALSTLEKNLTAA